MKRIILILVLVALACGQALAYTGFAVGDSGGNPASYLISKIDGNVQTKSFVGATGSLRSVKMVDLNTVYAVGSNGFFASTVNSGASWDTLTLTEAAGETLFCINFSPLTNTILYACGSAGTILKSTNGGTSWTAKTSGSTKSLRSIAAINDTLVYAVGTDTTILKSVNGGTAWSKMTVPANVTGTLNSIAFYGTTGYICGNNGNILKTVGGSTWSKMTTGSTSTLLSINCLSATQAYCISSSNPSYLLKTTDGSTWSSVLIGTGTTVPISQKTVDQFTSYVLKSNSSPHRLIYTTNSGATWPAIPTLFITAYYRDLDILVEQPFNNRYISTLFSAQDIDSTFSYYTPPVLANNFGWFGLYVYSYGTTPRYKITLEGAPTLSDPFIAPADSIVADSCGMAGFVNQWVTVRVPPGQYFRLKYTGLSGNGANTTNTSKLYSWGQ